MFSEQTQKLMADAQAAQDKRDAEKKSQDMVNSELRYALKPVLEKLESIEQRLIVLENALIPKD